MRFICLLEYIYISWDGQGSIHGHFVHSDQLFNVWENKIFASQGNITNGDDNSELQGLIVIFSLFKVSDISHHKKLLRQEEQASYQRYL